MEYIIVGIQLSAFYREGICRGRLSFAEIEAFRVSFIACESTIASYTDTLLL